MNKNASPIMLGGMHRSGTSIVTRILSQNGLNIGQKLDSNSESIYFQRINIWMMSLISSSWDKPSSFNNIDEKIKSSIVLQLEKLLNSRANSIYLGWLSIIMKRSFYNMKDPWGWKDPRNTFTEPIWRKVFPSMKAIHVIRHPIDIAESLMHRQVKETNRDIIRLKTYLDVIKTLLSVSHSGFNSSMIISSYDDCFKLIELYFDQLLENKSNDSIIIKFEDILSNPKEQIDYLVRFCGLNVNDSLLSRSLDMIDFSKSFSYKQNPKLVELEGKCDNLINKMGYAN